MKGKGYIKKEQAYFKMVHKRSRMLFVLFQNSINQR